MLVQFSISFVIIMVLLGIFYDDASALNYVKKFVPKPDLKSSEPFSINLPDNWTQKSSIPYAYANTDLDGNHILIDSVNVLDKFASRDDFHSYLLKAEFMRVGFGLGNSITTFDTDYGYKSVIELKLRKADGDSMVLRKDYHFVNGENKIFEVYGYSSDMKSYSELKKTLNTFRPL